jgi:hypothetical protein
MSQSLTNVGCPTCRMVASVISSGPDDRPWCIHSNGVYKWRPPHTDAAGWTQMVPITVIWPAGIHDVGIDLDEICVHTYSYVDGSGIPRCTDCDQDLPDDRLDDRPIPGALIATPFTSPLWTNLYRATYQVTANGVRGGVRPS